MFCGTADGLVRSQVCVEGIESGVIRRTCDDGSAALDPLFRRALDPAGGFLGGWEQVDNGGCPEDRGSEDVVLSVEEFRRLPLSASPVRVQPADGRALVGMGVAVHSEGTAQDLVTSVAGVPVEVRATPVGFEWDFGDGSAPVLTGAGAPWPDPAHVHPYPVPGQYQVRVRTTWEGQFRVQGTDRWWPVLGTATTTSAPAPVTVETAPARLVAEP